MIKSKYILYGIVAIVVIAVFVSAFAQPHSMMGGTRQSFLGGFIQKLTQPDVSYSDFEISASWDNKIDSTFYFDVDNKVFNSWYSLKITSSRDDLYYRVYDKSTNDELTSGSPMHVGYGDFNANAKLKTIDQSKDLEVCVFTKRDFTKNTEGIICKSTVLQPRKINIEVSPDPLTFMTSKSVFGATYEWLTVKNSGDTEVTVCVFPPSYANEKLNYPKYKPQYMTRGGFEHSGGMTKPCESLKPSESSRYEIGTSVGNFDEFDTPVGTHTSQGIVGAVFGGYLGLDYAHYTKSFTLETTVTQ